MPSNEVADDVGSKPWTVLGYLWRVGIAIALALIIGASGFTFWYITSYAKDKERLNDAIAAIRVDDGLLTIDQFDDYYKIPDGEPDLTQEYLQALAFFQVYENKRLSDEQLNALPHVGIGKREQFIVDENIQAMADDYLQKSQPTLDQLRALAVKPGAVCYPISFKEFAFMNSPHRTQVHDACRFLLLDFELQSLRANRQRALADVLAVIRLGETFRYEPLTISQMSRISFFGIAREEIAEFLSDDRATADELAALDSAVEPIDYQDGLVRQLVGETSVLYREFEQGDPKLVEALVGDKFYKFAPVVKTRPADVAAWVELQGAMLLVAKRPFPLALDAMEALNVPNGDANRNTAISWRAGGVLSHESVESVNTARGIAMIRALQTVLAIEKHRLQKGSRPQDLSDLVLNYLPKVPRDPFTDQPLLYVLREEEYLVYSVGRNKLDDGGQLRDGDTDVGFRIRTQPPDPPQ